MKENSGWGRDSKKTLPVTALARGMTGDRVPALSRVLVFPQKVVSRRRYFLGPSLRLIMASFLESKELRVLVPLEAP